RQQVERRRGEVVALDRLFDGPIVRWANAIQSTFAMARREVGLLLGPFELDQRRADVLFGRPGAVLLLVGHLVNDRASGRDSRGKSIRRTRLGIDELIGQFAARAVLIIVQQRLE